MADVDALKVARFMFEFESNDYDVTEQMVEEAWNDEGIRLFWIARAEAVLEFIGYAGVED